MQRNDKNVTNVTNGHTVEYATASGMKLHYMYMYTRTQP